MDKLIELLNGITEDTTVEEMRRAILDVVDALENIRTETAGYVTLVNEQQTTIDDLHAEIARLKEENGRIYRERAESIQHAIDAEIETVEEKTAEEIESELMENIDI